MKMCGLVQLLILDLKVLFKITKKGVASYTT